ncbi:MAG: DUF4271 domain-containing protein, partial [Bacteroidetes bacterium]|nr:DUF4271 domain-containing protein [Bacteroidota bacterium]
SEFASFWLYIKILLCILIFYILKTLLYVISGFVFGKTKETSDYLLNVFIFGQIAGIFLLPVMVLTTYLNNVNIFIVGVLIFSALYSYRLYSGIMYATSVAKISMYYLFLYLCTLEILPILILIKVFRIMSNC